MIFVVTGTVVCVGFVAPRYVDVMLALIDKGGEFVSNDIWHRVVQVITEQPSLQPYGCTKVVQLLQRVGAVVP